MLASFVCPTLRAAPSDSALTVESLVFLFGCASVRWVGVVNSEYLGRGGAGEFSFVSLLGCTQVPGLCISPLAPLVPSGLAGVAALPPSALRTAQQPHGFLC